MAENRNRELRFSRSGRILKKTLKMKEMEDLHFEDGRQEKPCKRLIHPSKHHKMVDKQAQCLGSERTDSNSNGSLNLLPSSDSSSVDVLYSKPKRCHVTFPGRKFLDLHGLNDVYSSDEDRTWNTDISSSNESEEKSRESLKIQSKQRSCKKNSKRIYTKSQEHMNLKHKAGRKTTAVSKRCGIQIKTMKKNISASNYYCLRKMTKIEDMNKKLLFTELSKRLSNVHSFANLKKETEDNEQHSFQYFENFSVGRHNKISISDTVINHFTSQEHQQQSQELLESNPVLGIAPVDVSAHLILLGDSLSKIGITVTSLKHVGPGVYSCLLDVLLCSMGPLLCLTRELVGSERLPEDVFYKILDHIAYIIPGL